MRENKKYPGTGNRFGSWQNQHGEKRGEHHRGPGDGTDDEYENCSHMPTSLPFFLKRDGYLYIPPNPPFS